MKRKAFVVLLVAIFTLGLFAGIAAAKDKTPFKILLVGYGWYRGIPEGQINNAELVAMALDGKMVKARDWKGKVIAMGKVHSIAVPVTWEGAFPPVEEAINALHPDIVLGLGTAGDMRVEPYGTNVMWGCDANPDDPSQEICMQGQPIDDDENAPDYRMGSLPYDEIVLAMLEAGIPVWRGYKRDYRERENWLGETVLLPYATPGWYLCNFMAYSLPMYVEKNNLDMDVGFIHIATQPQYRALSRLTQIEEAESEEEYNELMEDDISYSLELERTIAAIEIALEETVRARVQR